VAVPPEPPPNGALVATITPSTKNDAPAALIVSA
jgi:hypothetical protein